MLTRLKAHVRGIICDEQTYQNYGYKWENDCPIFNIKTSALFSDRAYQRKSSADIDLDVIAMLYSSGTTSEPKGVMITYEAQMKSCELLLRAFGTNDIRYLLLFREGGAKNLYRHLKCKVRVL